MNVIGIIKENAAKCKAIVAPKIAPLVELFRERREEILYSAIVLIVALSSFELGRSSIKEEAAASDLASPNAAVSSPKQSQKAPQNKEETSQTSHAAGFVASKSGTKYYPSDCSAANRISAKNKIFFGTEEAAKAKGYSRASNCQY